jgi:hypothetical protein
MKNTFEFKFLFEYDYIYEDFINQCIIELHNIAVFTHEKISHNEGYLRITFNQESLNQFRDNNDVLRFMLEIVKKINDYWYIEETINFVNDYTGERIYGVRII